ncbi:hypothetical protein MMMDOFMJ_4388 [Methylobacterium gnaphalii]|uniref:Rhodanese domain-containing protein n=2 Tax=Methylobacterium gnaphalii TaxID=1010610 RepID=A0A512JRA0_9HYPH|nr:hypothetical protein MGN01_43290 [Methylobacterium gnaphalii]GJD71429.1 hypothetical protein MMMDOFMJ_4388 [Methylobacterium gnaphalii]GLS50604.1 hypothetical protein GCM10007885_34570 [Methylobacterium gnaphalii]
MHNTGLLDPSALSERWLVLDARSAENYRLGHWPRAIRVPVTDWETMAKQTNTDLAQDRHWRGSIGALGIDGRRPVAVYDDGRMTEAARVWFILQHFEWLPPSSMAAGPF